MALALKEKSVDQVLAEVDGEVDLGRVRVTHQGRLVGAAPLGGKPRSFQVDSGEHAGVHVVGQFRYLPQQFGRVGGD